MAIPNGFMPDISAEALAAARQNAAGMRQSLVENPGPAELLTVEELENAAPFYLVLRDYVAQLKAAREAVGLTLSDISERTGIPVESLSQLEAGAQTNPTWKILGSYAAALGRRPCLAIADETAAQ